MRHTYRGFAPKVYKGYFGCHFMPGGEGCKRK